jgi:hypothetical protein
VEEVVGLAVVPVVAPVVVRLVEGEAGVVDSVVPGLVEGAVVVLPGVAGVPGAVGVPGVDEVFVEGEVVAVVVVVGLLIVVAFTFEPLLGLVVRARVLGTVGQGEPPGVAGMPPIGAADIPVLLGKVLVAPGEVVVVPVLGVTVPPGVC